jgi:hypothetical protein
MSQPEKYGEESVTLSVRVPKSKAKYIKKQFKAILKTYEIPNKRTKA